MVRIIPQGVRVLLKFVLTYSKWSQMESFLEVLKTKGDITQFEGIIRKCLMMNRSLVHSEAKSWTRRTG